MNVLHDIKAKFFNGDGYLLKEVKEMSNEELVTVLTGRIKRHIECQYEKSKRYGLID